MGKKVIALVEENYEDLELLYPVIRLREEGYEVIIAGPEAGKTYNGKHGYPVKSDISLKDVKPDDYSALVVPGGWAPDRLRRYREVKQLIDSMNRRNKPVATICHAGWVLVTADALKGRKVTSVPVIRPEMEFAGAEWVDKSVVVDKNYVSSRTPADLPDYMKALIKLLEETA